MLTLNSDKLTNDTRRNLLELSAAIDRLTKLLHRAEGERDRLILALADQEGAHDRRFVPVR
ncbi:MAG: hypothetical protein WD872_16070 [Pirellulaceae bacterium]